MVPKLSLIKLATPLPLSRQVLMLLPLVKKIFDDLIYPTKALLKDSMLIMEASLMIQLNWIHASFNNNIQFSLRMGYSYF